MFYLSALSTAFHPRYVPSNILAITSVGIGEGGTGRSVSRLSRETNNYEDLLIIRHGSAALLLVVEMQVTLTQQVFVSICLVATLVARDLNE